MKSLIATTLILLLLSSCGSKKKISNRQSSKVTTQENRDILLQENKIENTQILTDSIGNRTTWEPINPERESRVGDATFKNVRITHEDVRETREELTRDSTGITLQDNSQSSSRSANDSRITNSDVKRQSPWLWVGIAVLVFLLIVWLRIKLLNK